MVAGPFDCLYGSLAVAGTFNAGLFIGWSILNIGRIAFALLAWFFLSLPVKPDVDPDTESVVSTSSV